VSVQEDFDVFVKLGVAVPCYVRKVDRPTHCGDVEEDSAEERAAMICENVLLEDDGVLSFFIISDWKDLIRAALALNWHRTGGTREEALCLLAFKEEELKDVAKDQTDDNFACGWARKNHWNIKMTEEEARNVAVRVAERAGIARNFTKPKMKAAKEVLLEDGCPSVKLDSTSCKCSFAATSE